MLAVAHDVDVAAGKSTSGASRQVSLAPREQARTVALGSAGEQEHNLSDLVILADRKEALWSSMSARSKHSVVTAELNDATLVATGICSVIRAFACLNVGAEQAVPVERDSGRRIDSSGTVLVVAGLAWHGDT